MNPDVAPQTSLLFGKLGLDAIPFGEPLPMVASGVVAIGLTALLFWTWRSGYFPYL